MKASLEEIHDELRDISVIFVKAIDFTVEASENIKIGQVLASQMKRDAAIELAERFISRLKKALPDAKGGECVPARRM